MEDKDDKISDVPSVLEVLLPESNDLENALYQEDDYEDEVHPKEGFFHEITSIHSFQHQKDNVQADQPHHYYFIAGTVHQVKDTGLALVLGTKRGPKGLMELMLPTFSVYYLLGYNNNNITIIYLLKMQLKM